MPTLGSNFLGQWIAMEAAVARGEDSESEPDEPFEPVEPPAGGRRSRHSEALALAAIADAMGTSVDELDVEVHGLDEAIDVIRYDLDDPKTALQALDAALERQRHERAAPGESDLAYRVREGNWREQHNMPRKRKSVPPSRTPEARRLRHLQGLVDAGKFPDLATADAMTPRKGANRRRPPESASESPNAHRPQLR
jgi:hypothetical protein